MKTESKNKTLILIIGILFVANIATLSFFLMSKNGSRGGRQDRKAVITDYLKKEVNFTTAQMGLYDTLSKQHRIEMRSAFDEMATKRESVFKQLGSQQLNDSALDHAATAISDQQRSFEIMMLHHLKDIRDICTPAQKLVFDTGFYKILSRKGEGRKN